MLQEGTKAPGFSLSDQNETIHILEEYKGKKVILYFYPGDNTAGCTRQACGFGELYPHFPEKDAVVIGISKDSVSSHNGVIIKAVGKVKAAENPWQMLELLQGKEK